MGQEPEDDRGSRGRRGSGAGCPAPGRRSAATRTRVRRSRRRGVCLGCRGVGRRSASAGRRRGSARRRLRRRRGRRVGVGSRRSATRRRLRRRRPPRPSASAGSVAFGSAASAGLGAIRFGGLRRLGRLGRAAAFGLVGSLGRRLVAGDPGVGLLAAACAAGRGAWPRGAGLAVDAERRRGLVGDLEDADRCRRRPRSWLPRDLRERVGDHEQRRRRSSPLPRIFSGLSSVRTSPTARRISWLTVIGAACLALRRAGHVAAARTRRARRARRSRPTFTTS